MDLIKDLRCKNCGGSGEFRSGAEHECPECNGLGIILTEYGQEVRLIINKMAIRDSKRKRKYE